jgi:hypothetical protein
MRLSILLTHDEFERLQQIASAERRPVQDQAALLLARSLDPAQQARDPAPINAGGRSPRRRAATLAGAAR